VGALTWRGGGGRLGGAHQWNDQQDDQAGDKQSLRRCVHRLPAWCALRLTGELYRPPAGPCQCTPGKWLVPPAALAGLAPPDSALGLLGLDALQLALADVPALAAHVAKDAAARHLLAETLEKLLVALAGTSLDHDHKVE